MSGRVRSVGYFGATRAERKTNPAAANRQLICISRFSHSRSARRFSAPPGRVPTANPPESQIISQRRFGDKQSPDRRREGGLPWWRRFRLLACLIWPRPGPGATARQMTPREPEYGLGAARRRSVGKIGEGGSVQSVPAPSGVGDARWPGAVRPKRMRRRTAGVARRRRKRHNSPNPPAAALRHAPAFSLASAVPPRFLATKFGSDAASRRVSSAGPVQSGSQARVRSATGYDRVQAAIAKVTRFRPAALDS